MINLTGHPITICDENGEVTHYIPISDERPLRATMFKSYKTSPEGFQIGKVKYSIKNDLERLKHLSEAKKGLLVSHVMASVLKDIGYKGAIYTTGKKIHKEGVLVGCAELIEYKEEES